MASWQNRNGRGLAATIRISEDGRTLCHIPLGGIILHTELRVATEKNLRSFRCPCRDCKGGYQKTIQVIRRHHAAVGRDPFPDKSLLGRDSPQGYPPRGMWVEDIAYDNDVIENAPADVADNMDNVDTEDGALDLPEADPDPPLDEYHEVHRQVMEALERRDALHVEADDVVHFEDEDEHVTDDVDGLEDLYRQATTPTYPNSRTSVISATIIIMNMCTVSRLATSSQMNCSVTCLWTCSQQGISFPVHIMKHGGVFGS